MAWFNVLKALREKSGESMAETADTLNIAKSTYASYEYGKREPNIEMLTKIANHYHVTVDYLLGREPAPNPFADLNLSKESEEDVINKYMSLPPEIRACLMDVLVKLGEVAKIRREQEQTVKQPTTLGTLEDQMEEAAKTKRRSIVLTRILKN